MSQPTHAVEVPAETLPVIDAADEYIGGGSSGFIAATAAALAARQGGRLRDLDVHRVQRALLDQDAILATGARAEILGERK